MKKSRVFGCSTELEQYRAHMLDRDDPQHGLLDVNDRGLLIFFNATEDGEQVSVIGRDRVPSHEDMVWVRRHFWPRDAWVVQPYPSEDTAEKGTEFRLDLCRVMGKMPMPPKWLTGEHEVTDTNMTPES